MLDHGCLFLAVIALVLSACSALLEEKFLSPEVIENGLGLAAAPIFVAQNDFTGIHIATSNLVTDLEAILGTPPDVYNLSSVEFPCTKALESAIVIGSLTRSALIKRLVDQKKIDVAEIDGAWESFKTFVVDEPFDGVDRAFVIAGSDKRGTIFGIYTLSEQAGQSPYHWWADVPAKKHKELYALPISTRHGEPSVRYRGLFINDEAPSLESWWNAKYNSDHIKAPLNSEFYSRVFELLLRLKANFMWPAMWASWPKPGNIFFTDDQYNQKLADDYGIVVSTSHHEPMQRATNEWLSSDRGDWDWVNNRANVSDFMENGVTRAVDFETYFTIGMRGSSDATIEGGDPINIIRDVFEAQREIFKRHKGSETAVKQAWTIYKEVATYYRAGLVPPDDVTLLLPDDNFGNVQRLPTPEETARSGGSGIYFHLEYVGKPVAYKWTNNNALPKILKDLSHVHWTGANEIWVVNIGDVKPMELPFGFVMDYGWNTSTIGFSTIPRYTKLYAEREFGSKHAEEIGSILMQLNHLIGLRKYEGVRETTFSVVSYDETNRILEKWQKLFARSQTVYDDMSKDYKPAFFELVHYPVKSGYIFYNVMLNSGKNQVYGQERRNSANDIAHAVLKFFDRDYDLTEEFDNLLDGKWRHIMRQTRYDFNNSWVPPSRDTIPALSYVQLRQNTVPALGNLGVVTEGYNSSLTGRWCEVCQDSKPMTAGLYRSVLQTMTRYSRKRSIELFMRGDYRVPVQWSVQTEYPWLRISQSSGTLHQKSPDQRLDVTVDWKRVPERFNQTVLIHIRSEINTYDVVNVTISNFVVPDHFHGFPEDGGIISMEAPHFQAASEGAFAFSHIPFLGSRTISGSLALRPFKSTRLNPKVCKNAFVDYHFFLFSTTQQLEATLYFNLVLDTDPDLRLEFSATIDDSQPKFQRLVEEPSAAGGLPSTWLTAVLDGVWTIKLSFADLEAGEHFLRFATNSPEIYLEKVVLSRPGTLMPSYLGPPETAMITSNDQSTLEEKSTTRRYGEMPIQDEFYHF